MVEGDCLWVPRAGPIYLQGPCRPHSYLALLHVDYPPATLLSDLSTVLHPARPSAEDPTAPHAASAFLPCPCWCFLQSGTLLLHAALLLI